MTTTAAIGLALPAAAATVDDGIAYVLSADGSEIIVSPDMNNPGVNTRIAITGVQSLEGIAYRPSNGTFVGYDDDTDEVYSVDVTTGVATLIPTTKGAPDAPGSTNGGAVATTSPNLGIDFNNVLDAARIVSENNENLVYFPSDPIDDGAGFPLARAGSIDRFTDAFFREGDPDGSGQADDVNAGLNVDNGGAGPQIVANAYTNAVPSPETTVQRVLLAGTDSLGLLANNSGIVDTIGQIMADDAAGGMMLLDVDQSSGYDILSFFEGDNLPIIQVVDEVTNGSALFTLDGVADGIVTTTRLGGYGEVVRGLAVAPNTAVIPVPAAGVLLIGALAGLGALRRRRG